MRRIEARRKNAKRLSVEALPILCQAAAAVEPRNGALDDPALGQDHKAADLIGTFDDFDLDKRSNFRKRIGKFRSFMSAIEEQLLQTWKHPEQCRHDESTAIAILDIGRMNDGVEEAYCVDKNVPLLALDLSATSSLSLLARIVPVRINARPLFRRFSRSGCR
jgi:hypothetical protein